MHNGSDQVFCYKNYMKVLVTGEDEFIGSYKFASPLTL